MKAMKLEPSPIQVIQIQQMILVLSELTYNAGVEAFNADNFPVASKNFLRSFELTETQGTMDTTTLYNAGLAAELGKNYTDAKKIYGRLIEMEYKQPYLFSSMSNISMAEGDTVTALKNVLKGREAFPDDLNIIFNEANIYIFTGQSEKAKDILSLAIDKDPENPSLHFALAANFDRMAQDTTYVPADRKNFFNEAEKYYKQAIALDEDYFDAIYNIGVLYFNEACAFV
jgi:tetratricopeptide (TPR) repeat protein